jgi:hypothetical protein
MDSLPAIGQGISLNGSFLISYAAGPYAAGPDPEETFKAF